MKAFEPSNACMMDRTPLALRPAGRNSGEGSFGPSRVGMTGRAGFTLVEVALALLVASIGLLTVFSLFPAGLDMNRKAISDSQNALFAQDVFNGLRAQVARTNSWVWTSIGSITIPMTGKDRWRNGSDAVQFTSGAQWRQMNYESDSAGIEYSFRYQLLLNNLGNDPTRAAVLLRVISGQFNANATNAVEFYTELFNPAMP